jgi:hypothetical protein
MQQSAPVPKPSPLKHAPWSLPAFMLLVIAACGGRVGAIGGRGDNSGAPSGVSTGTVSGGSAGTMGAGASGAIASGSVASGSGTATSGDTSSGTTPVVVGDAGPDGGSLLTRSAGCGKPWNGATGTFVQQPPGCDENNQTACQAIPLGTTPAVWPGNGLGGASGDPEWRGWWVLVPAGYDSSKAYPVIYEGAGCDDADPFQAGAAVFDYNTVDNGQAILVGLDYDTFSDNPLCYDGRDPNSNDLLFFPWLMTHIEEQFCVDTGREFFSGYGGPDNGAGLANQLSCAMPSKLRAQVTVAGCEAGTPADPGGSLPTCNPAPIAAFFVHDQGDTTEPYACDTAACARILSQNGCMNTKCDPLDLSLTTPYSVPADVTLPQGTRCVSFSGCPPDYPVVFCTTEGSGNNDDTNWGVTTLLWGFMNTLPPERCPDGQDSLESGTCTPCPTGDAVCNGICVNEQADPNNCGECGALCPTGGSCQSGACVCPVGETGACPAGQTCGGLAPSAKQMCCANGDVCFGYCVNKETDPNNCGACNNGCPDSAPFCLAGVCSAN